MRYLILASVYSYLIGSINTAVILSEKIYKTDIRTHGSKNAGATNVMRIHGKKAGAIVFAADFSKGLIAVTVARCLVSFFNAPYETIFFAGFFAQLGHIFPLYFGFRGGKGVATAAGTALGVMPLVSLILLSVFSLLFLLTKTVSLASGVCAVLYPILAYFLGGNYFENKFVFAVSCAVMILVKHAPNIARLLDGEEKKISSD